MPTEIGRVGVGSFSSAPRGQLSQMPSLVKSGTDDSADMTYFILLGVIHVRLTLMSLATCCYPDSVKPHRELSTCANGSAGRQS
jgi:hypothetical protein